jgi:hypothetical protein
VRKKFLALSLPAVLALGLVPGTAGAAAWQGVVVAKDAKRSAIVTASRNGAVRTVRASSRYRSLSVGSRVRARANMRADGTYRAFSIRSLGRSNHARLRGVVVRNDRGGQRLIISAGDSVFAVRVLANRAPSGGSAYDPGDVLVVRAHVGKNGLEAHPKDVDEVGHEDLLELEGIYLFPSEGGFDIAVLKRGLVHINVPEGMKLPALKAGDQVCLVVLVEEDGSFTLASVENEKGEKPADEDDFDLDDGEISVKGKLLELSAEDVAVQPSKNHSAVRCHAPDADALLGFRVGDKVKLHCHLEEGGLVLASMKSELAFVDEEGYAELTVWGVISALSDSAVSVNREGGGSVTCAVPEGLDIEGFAVGDATKIHCHYVEGEWMLAKLKSDHAYVEEDGSSELTVYGTLNQLSAETVAVARDGGGSLVSCRVPAGANLSAFAVGNHVKMRCRMKEGQWMLSLLMSEHATYEAP